ncbi:MAG: bifunctional phosphoribosyl-AMP cyclohydrolase/phosphoribosyl-ATP diphosphatase HisIE [Clostridiales bacterium]|nr:bifunctional phosphoribosyl-AMP cyclohydrolase/phosphoribosyl-ATP diphosphatase HisIE [Clostridiales bacterium]
MKYAQKDMITTVFLKDGTLVKDFHDHAPAGNTADLIESFNIHGIDKIILFDLSDDEREHEDNLHVMKNICHLAEMPVYAGGNINSMNDIKKILYAGCSKVILNSLKSETSQLARQGEQRFGKERMALSIFNVDLFFKQKSSVEEYISELVVLDERLAGTMDNVTDMPYSILLQEVTPEKIRDILQADENIIGISGRAFCEEPEKIPELKQYLKNSGISTARLVSSVKWSSMKLNPDGLVPVVVQDYLTNEVLMLAYMNEESFQTTLETGKMTYYSRSRRELWIKGLTSGHYQYVKSLTADCDSDTILAKVSQVGAACHTGSRSCFFTDLVKTDTPQKNMYGVLTHVYEMIKDRKENPKQGSYTSFLFEEGIDRILKKVGDETLDLIFAAKNPDNEELKYQTTDLLFHTLVLMAERGITPNEVLEELMMRSVT